METSNIIGNSEIKEYLANSIKTNNVLHSYLFLGTEGIGKRRLAENFAKQILCKENGEENVNLLHSRFIQKDRSDKENRIKEFSNEKENHVNFKLDIVCMLSVLWDNKCRRDIFKTSGWIVFDKSRDCRGNNKER